MPLNSFSEFVQAIPYNFNGFSNDNPIIIEAAEAVNQGFNSLFYENIEIDANNIPVGTAVIMGSGAYSAWMMSFILIASGYSESGLSDLRKAIEFIFYAEKVIGSEKRARAWFNQRTDEKARKLFSLECAIPLCFTKEKYKALRPLLVAYSFLCSYGSHANFESMVGKYQSAKVGKMIISFMTDKEHTNMLSTYCISMGYLVLKNFVSILTPCIIDKGSIEKIMNYVSEKVRKAKLYNARYEYKDGVPAHVIGVIINEENEEVEKMFNEMIISEKEKKKQKKTEDGA